MEDNTGLEERLAEVEVITANVEKKITKSESNISINADNIASI